jgi:hypothetical protein
MDEGVRLLELARNARRLFERQEPREKRRLLNFLVSNCSWKSGGLTVTLRQPFDLLAETTLALEKGKAAGGIANGPSQIWLAEPDTNQGAYSQHRSPPKSRPNWRPKRIWGSSSVILGLGVRAEAIWAGSIRLEFPAPPD